MIYLNDFRTKICKRQVAKAVVGRILKIIVESIVPTNTFCVNCLELILMKIGFTITLALFTVISKLAPANVNLNIRVMHCKSIELLGLGSVQNESPFISYTF